MALLFLEHADEETPSVHVLGARCRRMHDGLLNHPVETERRLGLEYAGWWHRRESLRQHLVHLLPHRLDIDATHREDVTTARFIRDRPQQVLEADRIVPPFGRKSKGALNRLEGVRRERYGGLCH